MAYEKCTSSRENGWNLCIFTIQPPPSSPLPQKNRSFYMDISCVFLICLNRTNEQINEQEERIATTIIIYTQHTYLCNRAHTHTHMCVHNYDTGSRSKNNNTDNNHHHNNNNNNSIGSNSHDQYNQKIATASRLCCRYVVALFGS